MHSQKLSTEKETVERRRTKEDNRVTLIRSLTHNLASTTHYTNARRTHSLLSSSPTLFVSVIEESKAATALMTMRFLLLLHLLALHST